MEDLNKSQIVLLTLLVSFITSIATGIITVSLLQEAPVEVTRTINRVVEKTIETVVPNTITNSGPKETTTVVVKEEDLVISSINKNLKSIVRIKELDTVTGASSFYGVGLVVSKDGFITADRKTITTTNAYTATMSDGTEMKLTPLGVAKETNFILFKAEEKKEATASTTPTKAPYVFVPAIFATAVPQLGQTLTGLGGEVKNSVVVGRIISLDTKDSGTGTSTVTSLVGLDTDITGKDVVSGSPVFNLSGDLVGVRLSSSAVGSFTPVAILKSEINVLTEPQKAP